MRQVHVARNSVVLARRVVAALVFAALPSSARSQAADCSFDLKSVGPDSSCKTSTWCGGTSGTTITYGGTSIGTSGGGSMTCCLTELVIPAHTERIAGTKRIEHVTDAVGLLVLRKCSSPFILFSIEFGSWSCATDTITPFGNYPVERAVDCGDPPKRAVTVADE